MASIRYLEDGSPLAAFCATLGNLVASRKNLESIGIVFGHAKWRVFIDDLQMLFDEGVTFGCRTAWIRRVAVPVVMAQKALELESGTEVTRAATAIGILGQLRNADDALYATCRYWLEERFLKPKETPNAVA